MATITQLTENFTGATVGTAISISNTIFEDVAGAGTSVFITDPFDATKRMMEVVPAKLHPVTLAVPVPLLWIRFDIDLETVMSANTAIFQANDATDTNKILDVRFLAGVRQLQMRNINTAVWTSPTLTDNTKYRVYVYMKVDSTKRIRTLVYSGADLNTLVDDSGEITSTTVATTAGLVRWGALTAGTGMIRIGALRGDDALQPIDPQAHSRTQPDDVPVTEAVAVARGLGVGDTVAATESVAVSRGLATSDDVGVSDASGISVNLIGPSYWTAGRGVRIGG